MASEQSAAYPTRRWRGRGSSTYRGDALVLIGHVVVQRGQRGGRLGATEIERELAQRLAAATAAAAVLLLHVARGAQQRVRGPAIGGRRVVGGPLKRDPPDQVLRELQPAKEVPPRGGIGVHALLIEGSGGHDAVRAA